MDRSPLEFRICATVPKPGFRRLGEAVPELVDRAVEQPAALARGGGGGRLEIDVGDVELVDAADVEQVHRARPSPRAAARRSPSDRRRFRGNRNEGSK